MLDIHYAQIVISFIVLLFSLTIHEMAHAWTADRLGDPTARLLGRVSLNPLVHADPIGTIALPLIAAFRAGGRLAEWAQHEGEEYVYVLEGEILLELDGHEPVVLAAGDGAYYRADRRHTFTAC